MQNTHTKSPDFLELLNQYSWDEIESLTDSFTAEDVERTLAACGKSRLTPKDFLCLISPVALQYLEPMAKLSSYLTQKRFGHAMQLYAPLYLSNECANTCTYCGFSMENKIVRKTLSDEEILAEAKVLKDMGFDHVLIVTGESPKNVGVAYIKHSIELLREHFSQISIEVQPLEQAEYEELKDVGLSAVMVYQETYHKETYKYHHPKGKKSNFDYRLDTPERLGRAGVPKVGIGCLLGLENWRVDAFFVALHLDYLEKTYWQCRYSLSFPRLRPHAGGIPVKSPMSDKEMVQLICAYRLFDPEVDLSLSTRESEHFRNNVCKLGITTMSAASKTNPGGYSQGNDSSLEQFEISDDRSVAEVAEMLEGNGFQPVWKDWDESYDHK